MAIWDTLETALRMSREDITPKMIGCTFDGALVNQGAKGGIVRKLQDKIGHTFVSLWCAPHKLELSLLDTTKAKHNKTMVEIVESGVDPIYRLYYGSAKHRRQLNEIAEVLEPGGSRIFLGSLWNPLDGIPAPCLQCCQEAFSICHHALVRCFSQQGWRWRKMCRILAYPQEPLISGGPLLSDQCPSDPYRSLPGPILVTEVTIELNVALLKLTALKNQKGITYRGLQNYIAHNVYRNITLTGNSLSEEMMHSFLDDCTHFMEHRFAHLKSTPHTLGDLADYGNDELLSLVQYFASVPSDDESERIVEEWTSLKAGMMARS